MVSSSLGPEQAPQSHTQQSVYFAEFNMSCDISWFAPSWSDCCKTTTQAKSVRIVCLRLKAKLSEKCWKCDLFHAITLFNANTMQSKLKNKELSGLSALLQTSISQSKVHSTPLYSQLLAFQTSIRASITWQLKAIWRRIQEARHYRPGGFQICEQ